MSYGLDKHIDTTIQRLEENLWLPYNTSFKGRSWVIDKKNGNQPFAYLGNNEYKEVLATDLKDALIHFHVESNRPNAGYSTYTANVYIMVAVNLGKIYGSDSRAVERAHKEVTDVINTSPFGRCDLVTDIEAYNIYDLTEKQTKLFNMQPYYVFRLESEITYNANQNCPITEDQTYDVTTSIVGDGEINSNPETLTGIERNTLVSLNATANIGSRFVNWVYKGMTSVNRIISFYVTENISAIATFIAQWNLTTSVYGNGSILPASGVYDDNTVVDIALTPDEGYEIDRVESNSVEIFEPYSVTMTEDKDVIAYFIAILQIIQDIFSTKPVRIGANWYFNNDLNTVPNKDIKIVCYGNSIMFRQLPSYIRAELKLSDYYDYEVVNLGENSKTGTMMIDDYPILVAPEYDSSKLENYLFLFEFTNSLYIDGDTPEEAAQQLRDVAALAKATGYTVIIATATPASSALDPLESEIVASNTSIKNNYSPADYIYDIRINPDFTTYDATYFSDSLHLNELGKQSYADSFVDWFDTNVVDFPTIDAVQCLNNQCCTSPETAGSAYLNCGDTNWYTDIYYRHIFEATSFTPHMQLGGRRNYGTLQTDWFVKIENDIIQFWIFGEDATFRFLNFDCENINTNEIIDLEAWYDVPNKTMHIKVNGVEVSQSCDKTVRRVSTALILHGSPYVLPPLRTHYIEVGSYSDMANTEKFYFEQGQGDYVRGINGTLAEIKTISPADFWNATNKLNPYVFTLGCTIYINDSDSSWMPLIGDRSDVISGYTKYQYYPTESGIIRNLTNTYKGIKHSDWETNEKTFDEIYNEPESATFIPTKIANSISRLIIKQ